MASSSWMTTFYYQQDLRSLYMNGVLNAGFKPGIYNADMALYTVYTTDTQPVETNGLYLYIKKGTTLVFSNSVSSDSNGYHRDLSTIGTYLIKCVAVEDMSVQIAEIQSGSASSDKISALFGNTSTQVNAENKLFLTAIMTYDSESNHGLESPIFGIAKINPNRQSGESYYTLLNMESSGGTEYILPDGVTSGINENLSYLFMGVINTPYDNKRYTNGSNWSDSNSNIEWMHDHVFTARGLPDYRQTMIADDPSHTPDIIFSPTFKSLFIDCGDFSDEDVIYNKEYSWEDVYGVVTSQATGGDFVVEYIDEYSGKNCSEQLEEVSGDAKLLMDMLFITTRSKYSNFLNENNADITTMFNAPVSQDAYKVEPEVHRVRISSGNGIGSTLLNPEAMRSYYMQGSSSDPVLPLDVSKANVKRLLNFVRNRNVIASLISYMRYNDYLDPTHNTSIIPLALIFRGVEGSTPVDKISKIDTDGRINPANILSLADLQYKSTKLESMNIKDLNTYSVIPVIA